MRTVGRVVRRSTPLHCGSGEPVHSSQLPHLMHLLWCPRSRHVSTRDALAIRHVQSTTHSVFLLPECPCSLYSYNAQYVPMIDMTSFHGLQRLLFIHNRSLRHLQSRSAQSIDLSSFLIARHICAVCARPTVPLSHPATGQI